MHMSVAMTDIGRRRKVNQDYVYASDRPVGNLPNLYIVADGMGGHKAGELASSYAVQKMVEGADRCLDTKPALIFQKSVMYANYKLFEKSMEKEEYQGMGTTLVALTVSGGEAVAVNIGDSRLYEISRMGIRQISQDHSLVAELVRRGELNPRDARTHPDKNIITRALGIQKEVELDLFAFPVEQGNRYLLCSDGLTNMLDDEKIKQILELPALSLQEKAEKLIEQANLAGGSDNITVLIIWSDEEDDEK